MEVKFSLKQKPGSVNCYGVAAAMALNIPIEEITNELLPSIAPYNDRDIYRLMLSHGYVCGVILSYKSRKNQFSEYDTLGFRMTLAETEAFIIVASETQPAPTTHAIYWDGKKVFDPNPLVENGRALKTYNITDIIPITKL